MLKTNSITLSKAARRTHIELEQVCVFDNVMPPTPMPPEFEHYVVIVSSILGSSLLLNENV